MKRTEEAMEALSKEVLEKVADVMSGKTTLREIKGLTDAQMEMLYGTGYALYQAGRCKDAVDVFQILCLYDPYVARYWLGLAGSLERLGRFVPAAVAYRMLLGIEPENVDALVRGAEMELAAGDPRSAAGLVDRAKAVSSRTGLRDQTLARLTAIDSAVRKAATAGGQ
jgi:Flp pilus assembly protein TadD